MSNYPYTRGLTPFADASGHLQALDGCAPAALGKRAAARLIDTALLIAIGLIAYLPAMIASFQGTYSGQEAAAWLTLLAQFVWGAASLGYLVMLALTGYFPGGRMLGIRQVNIMGRAPGFAGVGKYLLETLLNVFTCNIGLLISFAVIKPPLNRAWYDTATGIVVLDVKAGRDPLARSVVAAPMPPMVHRDAVVSVGAAVPYVPPVAASTDQTSLAAPLALSEYARPQSVDRPGPSITPVVSVGNDGMITGVPWSRGSGGAPVSPDLEPQLISVHDAGRHVPAARQEVEDESDRTVVSLDVIAGLQPQHTLLLVSDDGQRIPLDKATVVGRNPVAPEGFPGARLHSLQDTTMSISKTHAVVGPDPDGVWVQDLRSTNGTAVTTANGMRTAVPSGGRLVAGQGAVVHIGKLAFRVTEQ
jgi:uncharacterized RDD family membrane protein YckC